MRVLTSGLAILAFSFCYGDPSVAQDEQSQDIVLSSSRENKEDPLKAWKWFHLNRIDHNGEIHPGARWEAFLEMRRGTLERGAGTPVANWSSLGPNTIDSLAGRMISHAFDPTDNNILWSGAGSGGLWRTTDAGELWEPMNDNIPVSEVSAVAINPANRDEMLIGTGFDRVMTTILRPGLGIFRSTDRGLTWDLTSFNYLLTSNVAVSRVLWHPDGGDTVYAAASNGLWKSVDGGENWILKRTGQVAEVVLDPGSPDILYAMFRFDGGYKSTDGGETWTIMSNGLPTGASIHLSDITLCRDQPEVLYASITNAADFSLLGFYKTTDGGDLWTEIANAPNILCNPGGANCTGWFVNNCAVSPVDPDLVLLGGIQFWRSDDGGATWTWHDFLSNGIGYDNSGLVYVDHWDIGFDPVDPSIIYSFNDGGVQKSTDAGLWWNKFSNNLVTALIYRLASSPSDTTRLIAGFQDHGHLKLDNVSGNIWWDKWGIGDGTEVIVHPTNPDIFYGSQFSGFHYKNTNGGVDWINTTFPIQSGISGTGFLFSPLEMNLQSPEVLYTSTTLRLYKTTNGGSLWQAAGELPNVYTIAVDGVNSDIVYAHSYTGSTWLIHRSDDAGETWTTISDPSIPTWRVVDLESDPSNEGTLYAVRNSAFVNNDHVKKSTDYGDTWVDITSNLPDITMSAIAISPYNSDQIYVGTDLGVFATTNGGTEWFEYNDGLPMTYVTDIHYHPLDKTLRVSTIGRGVWKTPAIDAVTSVEDGDQQLPDQFTVHQNYPNPFNPSTLISLELHQTGPVRVEIFNSLGQRINTIIDGVLDAGAHSARWEGTNEYGMGVSSGIYYARVRFDGFARTIKMVMEK